MVLNKGVKKCFGLLLVFSTIFGLSLNVFSDVHADSFAINKFGLYGQKTYGASNAWQTDLGYAGTTMHSVYKWEVYSSSLSASQTGKYAGVQLSGLINVPINFDVYDTQGFTIEQCGIGNTTATLSNINTAWALNPQTQTTPPQIIWSAEATLEFPTNNVSGQLYCRFRSNNGIYFLQHITTGVETISFGTTNFNANFNNTFTDELLQFQISQNQTIINQNQQIIDENNEAYDNISNQSASDIPNSSDSQTTSIIGVISGFLTALQSVQATDCELDLPFPQFLGGTTTVNVCNGKQMAPTIVTIGSSLLLICLFIPLAYVLLRMIYNEIRSWTNG